MVTVAVDLFDASVRPPTVQIDGSSVNSALLPAGRSSRRRRLTVRTGYSPPENGVVVT